MTTQFKIIVKDNLIYGVNALDPDQAVVIAKANGLLTPEAFTAKYKDHTLVLDGNGKIIRNQTAEVLRAKFELPEGTL